MNMYNRKIIIIKLLYLCIYVDVDDYEMAKYCKISKSVANSSYLHLPTATAIKFYINCLE